jgi:hypothetical protein
MTPFLYIWHGICTSGGGCFHVLGHNKVQRCRLQGTCASGGAVAWTDLWYAGAHPLARPIGESGVITRCDWMCYDL